MAQRFANAARGVLASNIAPGTTTIEILEGGNLFPVISGNDWFKAVLQDEAGIEIIRVNARTGNVFTVVRGQEGTTARAFSVGTTVGLRITAADVEGSIATANNSVQLTGDQTIGGVKTFTGNVGIGMSSLNYKAVIYDSVTNTDVLTLANPQIQQNSGRHFVGMSFQDQNAINGSGNVSAIRSYSNLHSTWGTDLTFWTTAADGPNLVERARIDRAGNFLVTGNITAGGQFIGNVTGNVTGNAGTVTNGVYTIGDQTISGTKTFTDNLGVGMTPSAWGSVVSVMQVRGAALSRNDPIDAKLVLSNNVYRDNGNQWFYMTTGFAAAMYQQGFHVGDHQWYVAGSGNANTPVSFMQAMTLTANGNLLVGGTHESTNRLVDLVSATKTHLSLTYPGVMTWGIATNADASLAFNNGPERLRIDSSGNIIERQPAPAAVNTTATLTVANLRTRIITSTTVALVTGTLPLGTDMDTSLYSAATDMGYDWSVINTGGANNFVVAGNGADHTVVGNMTVAPNASGAFRSRRTAANTWITYRVG